MTASEPPHGRTRWAERSVEALLARPLISEFVYRSPRFLKKSEKEVADFLLTHGSPGILISQKCQEDPGSRGLEKETLWALKHAKAGASQLLGALRTATGRSMWCEHPRRGTVRFPKGLPEVAHGLVLVETFNEIDLGRAADELPVEFENVSISYLSLNDFLNLTFYLRTLPEILNFLDEMRCLPLVDRRVLGVGKSLMEVYLLDRGSLQGCSGIAAARASTSSRQRELLDVVTRLRSDVGASGAIEHVADALATRDGSCFEGMPSELRAAYDPSTNRQNYLRMQQALADLRLPERAGLGRAFAAIATKSRAERIEFLYQSVVLDSKPEWVFVLGSTIGVQRPEIVHRIQQLIRGALAFYGKRKCLVIIDRDDQGYEVGLSRGTDAPGQSGEALGRWFFGNLKTSDLPLTLPLQL